MKSVKKKANLLAYKIFFWGVDSSELNDNLSEVETSIVKQIDTKRNELRHIIAVMGGSHTFYLGNDNRIKQKIRFVPFSGHSSRLAHYYRHLYQISKYLKKSESNRTLSEENTSDLFVTLRAQLSNQEQLLIYINYLIGFGNSWDRLGKKNEFLTKNKLIHNIPLSSHYFTRIEEPRTHFEKFINDNPNFDLFENG